MTLGFLLAVLVASVSWVTIIPRQTCLCNQYGSIDSQCDFTSKDTCRCRSGFDGTYCDTCSDGYFNFPNCTRKLSTTTGWPRPFFPERNAYICFNFEVTQKSLNMGRFDNYTFYLS